MHIPLQLLRFDGIDDGVAVDNAARGIVHLQVRDVLAEYTFTA
jgi:hypothetical protein